MQTYVLLALAGFLLALVAAIGVGTLLRRARPIATSNGAPQPAVLSQPIKPDEPIAVLPFDDSALADETQPVRPIASIAFSPLPDVTHTRAKTSMLVSAGEDAAPDPDHVSLLIEPDDEPSPQQRSVRRLIDYFKQTAAASEAAATHSG